MSKRKKKQYQFVRFDLTDINFKALECKGKSKSAWLHAETTVAYLEIQNNSAFVFEIIYTKKIFLGQECNIVSLLILDSLR